MSKKPAWSQSEIAALLSLAGEIPNREIAARLGRSHSAVAQRIRVLGLKSYKPCNLDKSQLNFGKYAFWGPDEEAVIRKAEGIKTARQLAIELNRTPNAVHRKAESLGVKLARGRRPKTSWTEQDENLLRELAQAGIGAYAIADRIRKSKTAVYHRAAELRVRLGTAHWWTPEDLELLRTNAASMTAAQLSKLLKRSEKTVRWKAKELGVCLRKAIAAKPRLKTAPEPKASVSVADVKPARDTVAEKQACAAAQPIGSKVIRSARPAVAWCPNCHAPVVNSFEGWAAHRQRIGCGIAKRSSRAA